LALPPEGKTENNDNMTNNTKREELVAQIEAEISTRKEAWKKELLERLPKNPYPEDIFTPITVIEWKKLNKLIKKEMGFSLDRVSGDLMRRGWNNCLDEVKKLIEEV
jgi:hypothetical protein